MADEIFTDWDDDFSRLNGASFSSCCESAIHQCDSCANEAYMSAVSKIEDLYDKSDDFSGTESRSHRGNQYTLRQNSECRGAVHLNERA